MIEKRKPLYKTNKLGTGQNKWIRLGVDPKYIVILNYKKILIFPNVPKLAHYLGINTYFVRRLFKKNNVRIIEDVIFIRFSFSNIRFFTKEGAFKDQSILKKITKEKKRPSKAERERRLIIKRNFEKSHIHKAIEERKRKSKGMIIKVGDTVELAVDKKEYKVIYVSPHRRVWIKIAVCEGRTKFINKKDISKVNGIRLYI